MYLFLSLDRRAHLRSCYQNVYHLSGGHWLFCREKAFYLPPKADIAPFRT